MRKILFYINTINFGGAERVIVNLANKFSSKGYEVVFVTSFFTNNEYELKSNIKRLVLEETELKESIIKRNINRIIKLRSIFKDEQPNIIISFMAEPNFRAIIASRFLKIPILISVRNDPNREYPNVIFRLMAKGLYKLVSGCVFQTEDARKWFPKSVQKKSELILNHVDEKFYNVNFDGKRKNIVSVGRLEEQKNHKLLIESFSKIAKDFPTENLIIYGEGSLKDNLIKLSKKVNLEKRIIFMGANKNIHEEIKNAKLFILASNYEGLPNVVMEAMTLGLPVIVTDCPCGGARMLINNNKNGLLVRTNNLEDMSYAIKNVLSNSNLADYLGHNAKITSKKFESSIVFEKWERYVLEIINSA